MTSPNIWTDRALAILWREASPFDSAAPMPEEIVKRRKVITDVRQIGLLEHEEDAFRALRKAKYRVDEARAIVLRSRARVAA